MNSKDQGLTVGELTMAIGIVIIVGLIWSNLVKKSPQKQNLNSIPDATIISHSLNQSTDFFTQT